MVEEGSGSSHGSADNVFARGTIAILERYAERRVRGALAGFLEPEDLVQETLFLAWRKLVTGSVVPSESARAWVIALARRKAADLAREGRVRTSRLVPPGVSHGPGGERERERERERRSMALDRGPAALELRNAGGWPCASGLRLGIHRDCVRSVGSALLAPSLRGRSLGPRDRTHRWEGSVHGLREAPPGDPDLAARARSGERLVIAAEAGRTGPSMVGRRDRSSRRPGDARASDTAPNRSIVGTGVGEP
jgi:hypothetical protein